MWGVLFLCSIVVWMQITRSRPSEVSVCTLVSVCVPCLFGYTLAHWSYRRNVPDKRLTSSRSRLSLKASRQDSMLCIIQSGNCAMYGFLPCVTRGVHTLWIHRFQEDFVIAVASKACAAISQCLCSKKQLLCSCSRLAISFRVFGQLLFHWLAKHAKGGVISQGLGGYFESYCNFPPEK